MPANCIKLYNTENNDSSGTRKVYVIDRLALTTKPEIEITRLEEHTCPDTQLGEDLLKYCKNCYKENYSLFENQHTSFIIDQILIAIQHEYSDLLCKGILDYLKQSMHHGP